MGCVLNKLTTKKDIHEVLQNHGQEKKSYTFEELGLVWKKDHREHNNYFNIGFIRKE